MRHLCVYVEPIWADVLAQIASEAPLLASNIPLNFLELDLEATIMKQAAELKCLRAQLDKLSSSTPHANPPMTSSDLGVSWPQGCARDQGQNLWLPSSLGSNSLRQLCEQLRQNRTVLSVLRKINPSREKANAPVVVLGDYYIMKNFAKGVLINEKTVNVTPLSLFSWLNIIRLDPQLTTLWFKITNLQKSYHLYKKSLLKESPRDSEHPSSTSGKGDSNCSNHTCPVVACEFNTMLEESNISLDGEMSKSTTPALSDRSQIRLESEDAVDMLTLLQKMWSKVKLPSLISEPLTYTQLDFLLRLYFNKIESSPYKLAVLMSEVESRNILQCFEKQIRSLFMVDGNDVNLNVSVFSSNVSDDYMMTALKTKGIYLSMLGIIVEEATDILRCQCMDSGDLMSSFSEIFPASTFTALNETIILSTYTDTVDFIKRLNNSRLRKGEVHSLLSFCSLLVATLNSLLHHYNKEDLSSELIEPFTVVFEILVSLIGTENGKLKLWRDPAQILFEGDVENTVSATELRILFCQLWNDIIRLINHVTMNFIPILKSSKKLELQVYLVLRSIVLAEREGTHVKFLSSVMGSKSSENERNLSYTLKVGYLISKALYVLLNGVYGNADECQVAISDIFLLVSQLSDWLDDISLSMLPLVKYFEFRLMLLYLELFLIAIAVHQGEELGDGELISKLIPVVFSKCLDIIKFLQGSCVQFSKTPNSTSILAIISEALGRISHLIAGLLIRFRPENQNNNRDSLPQTFQAKGFLTYGPKLRGQTNLTISVEKKHELILETDKTMLILERYAHVDGVLKKTKIWKFYSTFFRNSHKMNSESYAQLHSEELKSGKLLSMCPVMPGSKYPVSATRTEASRYPVSHGEEVAGLMELRDSKGGLPTISKLLSSTERDVLRAKFCPVTHADSTSIQANINSMKNGLYTPSAAPQTHKKPKLQRVASRFTSDPGFFADSGNEASHKRSFSEVEPRNRPDRFDELNNSELDSFVSSPRCAPPLCPSSSINPISSQPMAMPLPSMPAIFKQEQLDIMDWESLPNINLDFMSDELLMFQKSGDINNLLSESLFP